MEWNETCYSLYYTYTIHLHHVDCSTHSNLPFSSQLFLGMRSLSRSTLDQRRSLAFNPSSLPPFFLSPSLPLSPSPLSHSLYMYLSTVILPAALHNLYSTKITLEYQLPSSSQKLNTTNECIVSAFSGLTLTALQVHIHVHVYMPTVQCIRVLSILLATCT